MGCAVVNGVACVWPRAAPVRIALRGHPCWSRRTLDARQARRERQPGGRSGEVINDVKQQVEAAT